MKGDSQMGLLDKLLSAAKPSSQISDGALQRELNKGVGKNTGEDVATRASRILEGQRRGITADQKKEK